MLETSKLNELLSEHNDPVLVLEVIRYDEVGKYSYGLKFFGRMVEVKDPFSFTPVRRAVADGQGVILSPKLRNNFTAVTQAILDAARDNAKL